MKNTALVLVSCTHCRQLHEPQIVDVSNPLCAHCASLAARRSSPAVRFEIRPLDR